MDKLVIKKKNGIPLIYFDNDYGSKLDIYSRNGYYHLNYKNRTNGVSAYEFADYIINIFSSINITYSMIKNDFYDFTNELNSFVYKFNSIGFDINSLLKNHGYEDEYFVNRRDVIEKYYYNCIDNLDGDSLTGLIELVNSLYLFQVKIFKASDLLNLKEDLFENLKNVCSLDVYNYYTNLYESYLKQENLDFKKLEKLFFEIQGIILDDWKKNLSSVNDYKLGSPFKYICHSTSSNGWSGEYLGRFVSASLLTENHTYTYNLPYGLIMDPNDIIMAYSEDLYIRNNSKDVNNLYNSGVLPIVQSIKTVNDNTVYYNEVVLDGFHPIGIFCITDGSKELNPNYLGALKLKESFPDLPFIDLDITFFNEKIDTILARNGLVDSIEEKLGIYINGNVRYYEYFSYFWDDFMALKTSDYNSEDVINLFKKYYDLINIDLDELLNSDFDDDFVLKLIGANSRYNSINNIFNNSFISDDIKTFYELYTGLDEESLSRLNRLFPNFNNLLNSLDNFLIINNYDIDCFDNLGNFKTYDELLSFLDEDYNYNNSLKK